MAAVFEGAMAGVPSIGFSLLNYRLDADFDPSVKYVEQIARQVLKTGLLPGICLNVNIPDLPANNIKGIMVCRQANGTWQEDFDERTDPIGRNYYWLKGIYIKIGNGEDTDEWALENSYISIVPVQFDFTAFHAIPFIKTWNPDV